MTADWVTAIVTLIGAALVAAVHLAIVSGWVGRTDERVTRLFDRTDHIFPELKNLRSEMHALSIRFTRIETKLGAGDDS